MAALETLMIQIGSAIAKSVLKLWLKDSTIAQDASASIIDILGQKIPNVREQRRMNRQFDRIAEEVAERMSPYFEAEYRGLPSNEKEAAALVVVEALESAHISDSTLFESNLDPKSLENSIKAQVPLLPQERLLSPAGISLYNFALREACSYIVEIAVTLPAFSSKALQESLKREDEILQLIRKVLDNLPGMAGAEGAPAETTWFETQYRREVARKLDELELFGVTVSESSRRYALSVAYITLSASEPLAGSLYDLYSVPPIASIHTYVEEEEPEGLTSLPWEFLREPLQQTPSPPGFVGREQELVFLNSYLQTKRESFTGGIRLDSGPLYSLWIEAKSPAIRPFEEEFRRLARQYYSHLTLGLPTASRVDEVLAPWPRLLLRGEAGSGKTTLLQWLAVNSARRSFTGRLAGWNDTIPFFIQLRRYVENELPPPEAFVRYIASSIAGEMPVGWVHRQLKSGRALVLVDGLDEVPESHRKRAREWLTDLTVNFPRARYIVTSRPPAVAEGWLRSQGFVNSYLQQMTLPDIDALIDHWHQAAGENPTGEGERAELPGLGTKLKATIRDNQPVQNLAKTPLLCAMLCALHRDRKTRLPKGRLELYRIALESLLERRDPERDIRLDEELDLERVEKELLLQDIAYWLLLNGKSDAEVPEAIERVRRRLSSMPQVKGSAEAVFRHLLVRSGLLRAPVEGRVDFIHRTFQEYLAAKEVIEQDNIGLLLQQARSDQWREVIVLAAGQANQRQREDLIRGLLERGREYPSARHRLHLLAVACLETVPSLSDVLQRELGEALKALIPPKTMREARALASAGELAIPMLAGHAGKRANIAAACVRALTLIGAPECLPILHEYSSDRRTTVVRELIRAWPSFDPEEFAKTVLADSPLQNGVLVLNDINLLPFVQFLNGLRELRCNFSGRLRDLTALSTARELVLLDISRNERITDLAPLRMHGKLRTLLLSSCPSISDLSPIAHLSALQVLDVSNCPGIADIEPIKQLTSLQSLSLARSGVVDLTPLQALESLKELDLSGLASITNLTPLEQLINLKQLFLAQCSAVKDLSPLRQLLGLQSLSLAQMQGIRDIIPLEELDQLHELDLSGSVNVFDLSPLRALPHLTRLNLSGMTQLVNLSAVGDLGGLRELFLRGVPAASDLSQVSKLTDLVVLDVGEVPQLSDLSPLSRLEQLAALSLDGCTTVTDLTPLSRGHSLKVLSLAGCRSDLDLSPLGSQVTVITAAGAHQQ